MTDPHANTAADYAIQLEGAGISADEVTRELLVEHTTDARNPLNSPLSFEEAERLAPEVAAIIRSYESE